MNPIKIGQRYVINQKGHEDDGVTLVVFGFTMKTMHRNPHDGRTKKVPTPIIRLMSKSVHEYRWTSANIEAHLKSGFLKEVAE
jgi:hypothetical protein